MVDTTNLGVLKLRIQEEFNKFQRALDEHRSETQSSVDSLATGVGRATLVNELRAATGSNGDRRDLKGFTVAGDGGGGSFYWDDTPATDNNGTVFNAGGFGTSSAGWRRITSNIIDVRWFGATGNGSTNDSVAIQRAINTAQGSGYELYFPPGIYSVSGLTTASSLAICGASRTTSILKQINHSTTDLLTSGTDLRVEHLGFDGNKSNQTLTASAERKACVKFDGTAASLFIEDCDFSNTTAAGIHVTISNEYITIRDSSFRDQADASGVTLSYPDDAAAVFISDGVGHITIADNSFTQSVVFQPRSLTLDTGTDLFTSALHGCVNDEFVQIESTNALPSTASGTVSSGYVINKTNNTFQLSATQGGLALNFTSAGSGTLSLLCVERCPAGVEFHGTEPDGIGIAGGLSVTMSGNYFYGLGNTRPGIGCFDLYDFIGRTTIMGNRFANCTGAAIKCGNSSALVIADNSIAGQAWDFNVAAIFFNGGGHPDYGYVQLPYPDITVTGNAIREWAGGYGIHAVGDGTTPTDLSGPDHHTRGVTIVSNTIDGCRSGIFCDGFADSEIVGNMIRNSVVTSFSDAAIVFYRCCGDILISDNEILDNINTGVYSYAENPALRLAIRDNTFRNSNGRYQVYLLPCEHVEVSGNRFQGTSPTVVLSGGTHPSAAVLNNTHTEGTLSGVAPSGSGPTVTLTGVPKADNAIVITITTGGILGIGQWKWSKNGVDQETGLTLVSSYELGSTGVTANFAAGTYVLNETYTATASRVTGLVSVSATKYIHRGNTWDTIYGVGALTTQTINAGTEGSFNLYPWGASVGDFVTASCDKDLQGMQLTAEVSAENGVKVRIVNPTGGPLTITDARINCEVHKREAIPFTPDDLSTLTKLWIAADYGIDKDGSNKVSKARDQSRNDYKPATQTTGANQPTWVASAYNGHPTLRGGGGTVRLAISSLDLGAGGSVVWAMKASSVAAYEWGSAAGAGVISKVSGNLTEWLNGADRYTFVNNPTGLHIYAITQSDSGNVTLYYDGAVVAGPVAATVAFPNIEGLLGRNASSSESNGDIPEYIVCSGELLPGEVKSLTRTLGTKYSVTVA